MDYVFGWYVIYCGFSEIECIYIDVFVICKINEWFISLFYRIL